MHATLIDAPAGQSADTWRGAQAVVDFANAQLHIGAITPSMTQEECLFSARPELFLALVVATQLGANEALVVEGARRFVDVRGYGRRARCAGPAPASLACLGEGNANVPAVVCMDASVNTGQQFSPQCVLRDTNKAFAGFSTWGLPSAIAVVATGAWGCGAFGGDFALKALQQLMAAAVCEPRRRLIISAPDETSAALLASVTRLLERQATPVATAYRWINEFHQEQQRLRYAAHSGGRDDAAASMLESARTAVVEAIQATRRVTLDRGGDLAAAWRALERLDGPVATWPSGAAFAAFLLARLADGMRRAVVVRGAPS